MLILWLVALYYIVPFVHGGFVNAGFVGIEAVVFTALVPVGLVLTALLTRIGGPCRDLHQQNTYIDDDFSGD